MKSTKRKNFTIQNVVPDSVRKLLDKAEALGCEIKTFEGSLSDNHVIYDADAFKIGRIKPRKYAIIKEVFVNEWTSRTDLILTDNEKMVDDFVTSHEKESEVIQSEIL